MELLDEENMNQVGDFLLKPVVAGALTAVGQKMFVNQYVSWNYAGWTGAAVGAGVMLADVLYKEFIMKDNRAKNMNDTVLQAGLATAAGLTAGYVVNGAMPRNMGAHTAVILGSVILGDMVDNFVYPTE